MFENLSDRIEGAIHRLSGRSSITDINIADAVKDIRKALVEADVNYKIAKRFTDKVKADAMGEKVIKALEPGQAMVKIVRDNMAELMGGTASEIVEGSGLQTILMAGLQGSGKTTFTAKLGNRLKAKKGRKVMLVAADVHRPAAIDQLQTLGESIGVEVFAMPESKDPVYITKQAQVKAKAEGFNYLMIDTAGRLAIDEVMMDEIRAIHDAVSPQETLFVVDAMTGQDAVNTAKAFHEVLDLSGVVLTKLDGDTRGGAALSIRSVVDVPIKFIGTGEKMEALDVFHPERMADRILGMGDVLTLVEKAQEQFDEAAARKVSKRIATNTFGFDDFLDQIRQMKKMGNMKDMMGMIPGMGKAMKGVDIPDDAFVSIEAIIQSMTPAERRDAKLINGSRRSRIAMGSGTSVVEVNKLLKQFSGMSKMMKMMQGKGGKAAMMQMMKGR
ncbi:MAG: signal recognition particle protein [Flavobacteriales bacterium]|jgi:signal recognition particle subunit SRP54|nr:signal recognition particle protein [Flavobacteriales bacterium]MDE0791288.1 signal recognition particle protein [Schleiferiaceae bacterium]NCG43775.1 signal recognition particle protein [Pseudomonadota bacterium]MBT3572380.1 signal recognition particle protein [Flavobacteriales bacterium]MBT3739135.1 signal recognition particle protein [Flavobacteriales bacterium]|tara:strand:+ start:304 stop:1632 length:1329 start_codon:yes stop_codon:yes gene_type:complete